MDDGQHHVEQVEQSYLQNFEDPLQDAAELYCLPYPFDLYDEEQLPTRVTGNISHIFYDEDEGPQINDSVICINAVTIRLYKRKVDYISEIETPLMQVPITALESVVKDINAEYLALDPNDQNVQSFLEGAFALKLKEDFLCLFVDNYSHNGLEGELRELAEQGRLKLDQNTEELVKYYQFLERKTISDNKEVKEMD